MAVAAPPKPINWSIDSTSGFVSIGTHKVLMKAAGPPRTGKAPAVVIITALGAASEVWSCLVRLLSPFARVYVYDRSGLGHSEASPIPRTAENIALELKEILTAADIVPPYIVILHSYGGIIAREFLALTYNEVDVAGMVFVDTNSEFSYKMVPDGSEELLEVFKKGQNWMETVRMKERSKLTPEEWDGLTPDESPEERRRHKETALAEYCAYYESCDKLAEKKQYEKLHSADFPVISVIKGNSNKLDVTMIFEKGIELGNGTKEERAKPREFLAMEEMDTKLQKDQLKLSRRGRFAHAALSGHDPQWTEPEMIVEEVRWILKVLEGEE